MSGAREAVFLPDDRQEGQLKQLEFQSIYDLSLAITRNEPEEGLLRILENYLLESLGISHFTAFNLEDGHIGPILFATAKWWPAGKAFLFLPPTLNHSCYRKFCPNWKT